MNWYYVDAGKQAGPVDDAQLLELVSSSKITAETLIWKEGMADWRPYREVIGPEPSAVAPSPLSAPPIMGADQAVCAECGQVFARREMIVYGTVNVCAACKPVFLQKLAEGAPINRGAPRYAGFWIRAGAKVIDSIIVGVVFMGPLIYFAVKGAEDPGRFQVAQILWQLAYMAGNATYTILFLGKFGATPGKMACGLRVVTADGRSFGYGRATGRFFAEMLSGIICYIGYIIVAFDSEKRALHDHICNTRVVYK
jgi:uncharacterized RDD family membrane protein YckC